MSFNKLAWQSSYYSSPAENHVVPAPGRTALVHRRIQILMLANIDVGKY